MHPSPAAMGVGMVASATSKGIPNDRLPAILYGQLQQQGPQQQVLQTLKQPLQQEGGPSQVHINGHGPLRSDVAGVAQAYYGSHAPAARAAAAQPGTGGKAKLGQGTDQVGAADADQQLVIQHSLSDLYGNSQALPGVNLPPRVLAGSEADPTSAMTTTTGAAADADAQAAAPVHPVAVVAADRPVASRLHGRATSSAPTPGPDGSHAPQPSAAAPDAAMSTGASGQRLAAERLELQGPGAAAAAPSAPSPCSGAATAAAGSGRTKTIAVASHCPAELQPQPAAAAWTIDDFSLLKKLYEGSLSVVCQAQHRRSGRHVALKIYKRSRLHEMERFQVRARCRRGEGSRKDWRRVG